MAARLQATPPFGSNRTMLNAKRQKSQCDARGLVKKRLRKYSRRKIDIEPNPIHRITWAPEREHVGLSELLEHLAELNTVDLSHAADLILDRSSDRCSLLPSNSLLGQPSGFLLNSLCFCVAVSGHHGAFLCRMNLEAESSSVAFRDIKRIDRLSQQLVIRSLSSVLIIAEQYAEPNSAT